MTDNERAFLKAVEEDDLAMVSRLLDEHPGLTELGADTAYLGHTPLQHATSERMIELLMQRGAVWRGIGLFHDSSLHRPGTPENARRLIDLGAYVNARNHRRETPLHYNAWNLEIAAVLVDNGADLNATDWIGRAPLHYIAQEDMAAVDFYLMELQNQGKPLEVDDDAPIEKPDWIEGLPVAELLLSNGAEVDVRTTGWGGTPLHMAAGSGFVELAKLLVQCGADINAKDNGGCTPLHHAADGNNKHAAIFLISAGADVNAVDKDGRTPFNLAKAGEFARIIEVLEKYGTTP